MPLVEAAVHTDQRPSNSSDRCIACRLMARLSDNSLCPDCENEFQEAVAAHGITLEDFLLCLE